MKKSLYMNICGCIAKNTYNGEPLTNIIIRRGMINMKMSKNEYKRLAEKPTPIGIIAKDCILAFVVGGLICVLGQLICDGWMNMLDFTKKEAATATSVSLIFLSALFTGLKLYDKLAKHAGAGTVVPITGFANAVVSPALEFKSEGFVLGVGAKMFTIAGPVIVYGTVAGVVYGLVYWITTLF